MNEKMIELKPCPFCGGSNITYDHYIRDGREVMCRNCNASVHAFYPNASEKSIAAWNTRAVLASAPAADERLREAALAFVDKLALVEPAINNAFSLQAIHGGNYTGPNYGEELAALKAALAAPERSTQNATMIDEARIPAEDRSTSGEPPFAGLEVRVDPSVPRDEVRLEHPDGRVDRITNIGQPVSAPPQDVIAKRDAEWDRAILENFEDRRWEHEHTPEEYLAATRARLTAPPQDAAVEAVSEELCNTLNVSRMGVSMESAKRAIREAFHRGRNSR